MSNAALILFQLVVLIFSVMVHEVFHGAVAYKLGDPTAKRAGRLNLNPLKHLDPVGSVLLPLLLWIGGSSIMIGWAKPVPYNPFNLKDPKRGSILIGLAGPASNLALALVFAALVRIVGASIVTPTVTMGFFLAALNIVVLTNVVLAVFNLVPIPPLDGSKLLLALLPDRYMNVKIFLERYGLVLVLAFVFFGAGLIQPIIIGIYDFLVGPWSLLR